MRTLKEEMKAVVLVKDEFRDRKKRKKRFYQTFSENWLISLSSAVCLRLLQFFHLHI